ncbi:MAG: YggS family pyridoxal phosphate-dependent enzyme [Prevotellaceae bacterium]|nr:YggS family pyridoxal phosphate-dependent enzyme [Prevotellaceae bacterium]
MTDIQKNIAAVRSSLPDGVELVAVSKYHPAEDILEAYECGQRVFGESHEQELVHKYDALPKDIVWHFIGHLQSNKVKYIAPFIAMIEAVDSMKLLKEINRQAEKHNRTIDVLLELHIAEEATKYGFSLDDCREMLTQGEWREMKGVRICGIMMMATYTDNEEQIAKEFTLAKDFFNEVKQQYFADAPYFKQCSWGMSNDYMIAAQCDSTMVRVGTKIFGERIY